MAVKTNTPENAEPGKNLNEPENAAGRQKRKGRRVDGLSEQEVVQHGHDARRRHMPIWANPFTGPRAALWRRGWRRPQDSDVVDGGG